jgi:uncharacterized protein
MQLSQQQNLPVPQAVAWDALNDISLLQSCIPGCESLTEEEEDRYAVLIAVSVGPVKARFKGKLRIEDKVPPSSYRLEFEGQGGPAGHGKGHADVRLESSGPSLTVLHYTAHASVGGKLAQIGSRMIDMAAQKMAADFFDRFTAALKERYPETVETGVEQSGDQQRPSSWQSFVGWLRRLFGRASGVRVK